METTEHATVKPMEKKEHLVPQKVSLIPSLPSSNGSSSSNSKSEENEDPVMINLESSRLHNLLKATSVLKDMVPAVSVSLSYKNFKTEGEKCRGIFAKYDQIPNSEGKVLDSVVWMDEEGKMYYNSGIILVERCRDFGIREGVGIEITFLGKKKGRTNNFEVVVLKRNK